MNVQRTPKFFVLVTFNQSDNHVKCCEDSVGAENPTNLI